MVNALSLFNPNRTLWNPWRTKTIDLWDRFFDGNWLTTEWYKGGMEVKEVDGVSVVTAPVPGVPVENVNVEVADGVLTIRAENKETVDNRARTSSYYYSFSIEDVDPETITATYKDGILELKVPKVEVKEEKPKQIPVSTD